MLDDNNKIRAWLEYDSDKNQMHCKDCRMYANGESQKRGPFVVAYWLYALIKVEFLRASEFLIGLVKLKSQPPLVAGYQMS